MVTVLQELAPGGPRRAARLHWGYPARAGVVVGVVDDVVGTVTVNGAGATGKPMKVEP